jgi:hypothetical protein
VSAGKFVVQFLGKSFGGVAKVPVVLLYLSQVVRAD